MGVGGSFGMFLTRMFSVEGWGSFTTTAVDGTANDVEVARVAGTLLANMGFTGGSFFIGAGYEKSFYRAALTGDESGFHVLLGTRLHTGGRATFRIQGSAGFYPSSTLIPGQDRAMNLGLSPTAHAMRELSTIASPSVKSQTSCKLPVCLSATRWTA